MKCSASILVLSALVCGLSAPLNAQMIRVTLKNHSSVTPTGLHAGPVWLGFHDGGFDMFDSGATASSAIEALGELGDSSLINMAFMSSQPAGLSLVLNNPGGPGPGLFTPGASNSIDVDLNGMDHRYLSFGTMIVPSNDTFIANENPMALPLFDDSGNFLGPQTWTLLGTHAWDAGSEMNVPLDGAAFVANVNAMMGTSEGGMIHLQPADALNNVIGVMTPAGTTIGRALSNDPLFSISITPVPEPETYGMIAAIGLLGAAMWRRRQKKILEA